MDPLTWQTSIEYITHIQERDSLMLRALFKQEENRYLEYRNMTVEVQTFLTSALVALSWLELANLNPLFIKFYAHIPNLKVYILFCLCIFLSLYCDRELDPIHSLISLFPCLCRRNLSNTLRSYRIIYTLCVTWYRIISTSRTPR